MSDRPTVSEHFAGRQDCDHCDGTGECWEPCACYQCEYDDSAHARFLPCPNCDGTGRIPIREGAKSK